jgi:ABC-type glycerol-3-phosphate transport system permease component
MKQATTGTISGCLVWIIAFVVISMCILPISFVGSMTTMTSDFAIRQTGAIVCPDNTTPEVRTFATYGSGPSQTSVLQCVDARGEVVKEDPVGFAFLWIGILSGIGLVLASVLAFVFAAPAGVLIAKLLNRRQKSNIAATIEPE